MFLTLHRLPWTLLGTSTLLLSTLAHAQPTTAETAPTQQAGVDAAPAPAAAGANVPAPPPVTPAAPPSAAPPPSAKTDDNPRTLFGSGAGVFVSGYGHLDVAYTRVAGRDAALVCGGGALILDRSLTIGLTGCGVPTRIHGDAYGNMPHETGDRLELGYAGLEVGYHLFPKQLYNLSLSALVGGGGASIVNHTGEDWNDSDDPHVKTVDPIFVAEPRVTGYVNLTRWARVGAFVGYRFVAGVDLKNLSSGDLSGPVTGGTMQFGWF
jgi:hypothetical protein